MADVPMNVEGLLQTQENGGEGGSASSATSSSGPSAPKGEEDDILNRLGIKHVEESVASKDIISKAQARWAAAAERAQKAAVKSKVRKSSSSSTAKGGANGEGGEPAKTAKASSSSSSSFKKVSGADLDIEEAKGGGGASSSTKKSSFSAAVAEGKKKQQNGDSIDDGFDTEVEADNSDNDDGVQGKKGNRKVIKEVLNDESYQVRIGDLTPFEEQELAAEKKKEKKKARPVAAVGVGASAGSMASRGGGAGGAGASASSASGRNSNPSSSGTTSLLPPSSQGTPVGPPRDGSKSRSGTKEAGGNGMAKEETIPKKKKRPIPNAAASTATSAAAPSATAQHDLDEDSADSKPRSRIKESSSKQKASASSKERSRSMRSSSGGEGGGAVPSVRGYSSAMASQPSSVECPVCGRQVPVKEKERPDAELSEHLDRCMRRGGREAAASPIVMDESNDDEEEEEEGGSIAFVRRSTRKRRRVLDVDDDSEEGEESEDDGGREERKRSSGSSTTRAPVKRDPDMNFIDEESDDEEDDEEEDMEGLVDEGEDEEEGEDDDRKPAAAAGRGKKRGSFAAAATKEKKRLAAAAAAAGGKQRARGQLLIDDFAEDDYQRRLAEYEEALGTQSDDEEDEDRNLTQARHEGLAADEAEAGPLELPGGFTLSARINRRLYWYQRTGLRWLWELYRQGAGGILGDEMGLGKTVQLAAFLGGLRRSGNLRSALIVAPATLMSQWANEIFAWAPRLRVVILHRSAAAFAAQPVHKISRFVKRAMALEGVVCITTYESLKLLRHELLMHQWSYVAIDEGQKIRNPDAEITVCAKQLSTVHRIILSGTPIQNNLRELWSLFDFCFPGRLGTLPAFETELATPIRIGGYSNATPTQAQLAYRCALVLRDLIHPYLLRRMKKDIIQILPMPKKTEQVLFCKLTQRQRNIYRAALSSPEIGLILGGKASHFRAITILRKICNHADLAADPTSDGYDIMGAGYEREWDLGSDEEEEEDGGIASSITKREGSTMATASNDYGGVSRSGKLQVLAEILPRWEAQGHRVLLFSQTRQMLNILERMVKQNGWRYLRMDGNTSVGSRPALIDRFNNDESIFCFLLTTRTGGLGISLTGADRVILYDPDWNPQTDIQARERAWRLGQKRPVTIYRLVTTGTIEEKIYQRQIFKTAITNRVLQDPKQNRLFSSGELKELFTLKDDFDDEDAPNDTADVFMEGVVKRSSLRKRRRKKEKKRSRRDEGGLDDGVDGEGGVEGGASSYIVAIEENRRAVARDTRHHELEGRREEGGEGEADGDEVERRRMEGLGRVGEEEVHQPEDDDCKILKAVFNGKGIASVLSHDVVEEGKKNIDLWIQMQDQAKRIAERAARVLRESSADVQATQAFTGNRFTPTWTGRIGALPTARFGPRSTTATAGGSMGGGGGAAASANTNNPTTVFGLGQRTVTSSTDILSRFREREGVSEGTSTAAGSPSSSAAASSNGGGGAGGGTSVEEAHYVSLLERIKRFLCEKGPRVRTAQLLQNFRNVPNSDAVIFKTMLKEVATLSRGAWTLKDV